MGTRTSGRWAVEPGNFDTTHSGTIYPSANEWGIPDLPVATVIPGGLVAYNDRYRCETAEAGTAVHFFLDDYRFETVWSKPERAFSRCNRVGMALTPDFSLWSDMPLCVQLWQVYRSRWVGADWHDRGLPVIPTVGWSTPASYPFAFAGVPRGSVVAVSAVGMVQGGPAAAGLFRDGYAAMVDAVAPTAVLAYGRLPDGLPDTVVHTYPTRWR